MVSSMTVMNLLIGVLCEVVSEKSRTENELRVVENVKTRLRDIAQNLDFDDDGEISKAEFQAIIENEATAKALHDVGCDPVNLVDYIDVIFNVEQCDSKEATISFDHFMEAVLSYRNANRATAKDVADLRNHMKNLDSMCKMLILDGGRDYRGTVGADVNPASLHASFSLSESAPSEMVSAGSSSLRGGDRRRSASATLSRRSSPADPDSGSI